MEKTVREALREGIRSSMRADDRVFLIGEEVGEYNGAYKVSEGLLDEFGPRRVIDTPITEHGFTGLAVGAAFAGLRPIVEFMTFNFALQAMDQIINSAAKTLYMSGGEVSCPIVFRGPNGSAKRVAAQHSQNFSALFAHIPGLRVLSPFCSADAQRMLEAAVLDPNPVIFLEHEILYNQSFSMDEEDVPPLSLEKARIRIEGPDVTVVGSSIVLNAIMEAASVLEADYNIRIEVIDLRSLRPLDMDTILLSVKKTNRLVSVEEGWLRCGIGAEITSTIVDRGFDYLDAPPARVTSKDVPQPYAEILENAALPSVKDVIDAVLRVCYIEEKP